MDLALEKVSKITSASLTILPKATRPTPTKPRSTVKARNRAPLVLNGSNNLSGSIQEPNQMATPVNGNIYLIAYLQEQVAKLSADNEKLMKNCGRRMKVLNMKINVKRIDRLFSKPKNLSQHRQSKEWTGNAG